MHLTTQTGQGIYHTVNLENTTIFKILLPIVYVLALTMAYKQGVLHYALAFIFAIIFIAIPFYRDDKPKRKVREVEPIIIETIEQEVFQNEEPELSESDRNKIENYKNIQKALERDGLI